MPAIALTTADGSISRVTPRRMKHPLMGCLFCNMNDLSLHILDIVQNSLSAGATHVGLIVEESPATGWLSIVISDDGRGMSAGQAARVQDPFFTSRTTRKVGLGLPLFTQSARQSGGDVQVESEPGKGTAVKAWFRLDHIDRPPLGNVANAVALLASANPATEFTFIFRNGSGEYIFDTREVKEALDGVPLSEPGVAGILEELIANNIENLENE